MPVVIYAFTQGVIAVGALVAALMVRAAIEKSE
jgi:hypothetical protein